MKIMAIDPGTEYSAYVIMNPLTYKLEEFGKIVNIRLLDKLISFNKKNVPFVHDLSVTITPSFSLPFGL